MNIDSQAWDELQGCLDSVAEAEDLSLSQHWMTSIFTANVALESQENDLVLQICDSLEPLLSASSLLANLRATALYNMREFDASRVTHRVFLFFFPPQIARLLLLGAYT